MQNGPEKDSQTESGYLGGAYGTLAFAQCLEHLGQPVELPRAGCFVLQRDWAAARDALGPYPLLCPADPNALVHDLEALATQWLSLAAVIDPMIEGAAAALQRAFPDRLVAYKEHHVVDLTLPLAQSISGHHQRKAKRGQRRVRIEWSQAAEAWDTDWLRLYGELVEHHAIRGPAAFSESSLVRQLRLPGTLVQRACVGEEVVCMVLWYPRGSGVSYHLGASNAAGYEASASYALFSEALRHFQELGLEWAHLGAGAGVQQASSGLSAFKAGWSRATRTAYFGGRIGQREAYLEQCILVGADPAGTFFPAYRAPKAM